jgi:hypothetical protein
MLLMPLITNTSPVRALVGRLVAGRLRGAQVSIGTLRVAPFRDPVVSMKDLQVTSAGRPMTPILGLGEMVVHWRPADLLHRRLHLSAVDVDSVHFEARKGPEGWNFVQMLPRPGKPRPPRPLALPLGVQIDSLQVRGVELTASAGPSLAAAVHGGSARMTCLLSGSLQGSLSGGAGAESVAVETPAGSLRLDKGVAAQGSVENSSSVPHLAATLSVPQVVADVRGYGATKALPVGASLEADVDLAAMDLPRAEAAFQVPGVAGGRADLSLRGGPQYVLSARSTAAGDLGALLHALPDPARGPVHSLDAAGRALAVTELSGTLALKPHLSAYAVVRQDVYAAGLSASAGLKPAALEAAASGLRAQATQEVAIAFDGALGGLSVTDASGGAGSLRLAAGAKGSAEVDGLDFGLTARAALPSAASVDVSALASANAAIEQPLAGRIALPFAGGIHVAGADLLGPEAAARVDASSSAGALLPAAALSVRAPALRTEPLALRGFGALDAGRAVVLVGAMPVLAKLPVGSLKGAGAAGGALSADARIGGGLSACFAGAADVAGLGATVKGLESNVGRLAPAFSMEVTTGARFLPRLLDAGGVLRAESITAPHGVALAGMDAAADFGWRSSAPSVLSGGKRVALSGLSILPALAPLSLEAQGDVMVDAVAGNLAASNVQLSLGDLLAVSAPEMRLTGFGEGLSGSAHAEVADLGRLASVAAACCPPAMRARFPKLSGRAAGDVQLGGGLPLAERLLAGLLHGRRPALPFLFPLAAFYRDNTPLTARAHVTAEGVGALAALPNGIEAGFRGLGADATLDLSAAGDLSAAVKATLAEAVFSPSPVPLKDFGAEGAFSLKGFDALDVQGSATALGRTLTSTGRLSVAGLSRLPAPPKPADALRTLSLSAHAEGALAPGELKAVEGLQSSGKMAMTFDAALEPGRAVELTLAPRLDGFCASYKGFFSLQGLDGGFTYARRWPVVEAAHGVEAEGLSQQLIRRPPQAADSGIEGAFGQFGTAAESLADHGQSIRIGSLAVLGVNVIEDMGVRLLVGGSGFVAPQFAMLFLGGRTFGTAAFTPVEGGRALSAQGEFAGVDFRYMLPPELRDFSGDGSISGSFSFGASLGTESASPLKDVSARVDLTRMGSEALDRLLLFLDPRSANPSFVRLRQALSLASPRSVHGRLQRGFLSGSVELQGIASNLLSEYSIPPFNITGLFGMKLIDTALRRGAPALKALNLLDANSIELTPDGGVVLR